MCRSKPSRVLSGAEVQGSALIALDRNILQTALRLCWSEARVFALNRLVHLGLGISTFEGWLLVARGVARCDPGICG